MIARSATSATAMDSELIAGDEFQVSSRSTVVVAHIAFFTCLILQRFGLQIGRGYLSVSVPILFGLAAWMFISGKAKVQAGKAVLYLAFAAWAIASTIGVLLWPTSESDISITSLLNILLVYLIFILSPTSSFDGRQVQRVFLFYARLCAMLGIAQFVLQLGGIRLYSFTQMVPALKPILIEQNFAFDPVLSYGSLTRRSNGFFLLEASILSQVIVIALVLDYFILGRKKYLPLYAIAYLTSFSGTGLLALAITLLFVGLSSVKNFTRVLAVAAAGLFAGIVFSFAVPKEFEVFASRINELSSGAEGSSGHARFAAQGKQIGAVIGNTRSLLGFGPGSTVRSKYWTDGSGNPALQLFYDYGSVGLILFYIYFIRSLWSSRYAALSVMFLALFQLGGGYLQFAPFTLLFAALGIWASGPDMATDPLRRLPLRGPTNGSKTPALEDLPGV